MADLPSRLRAARAYSGLSQPELARKLELGEVTYKLSERGKRHVPRRELLAIAEACEVPMWFLEDGWDGWRTSVDAEARRALSDLEEERKTG